MHPILYENRSSRAGSTRTVLEPDKQEPALLELSEKLALELS